MTTVSSRGRVKTRKAPVPMGTFLRQHCGIGRGAQLALIHTRFATQGDKALNHNNHPIVYKDVVGVHNGMISNDFDVFHLNPAWERIGEVDSEAIFASLYHVDNTIAALEYINGSMATAFIRKSEPRRLNLAKGQGNPIEFLTTNKGSLFFASTVDAVVEGAKAAGVTNVTRDKVRAMKTGDLISLTPEADSFVHLEDAFDPFSQDAAWVGKFHRSLVPYGSDGGRTYTTGRGGQLIGTSWGSGYGGWDDDWDGYDNVRHLPARTPNDLPEYRRWQDQADLLNGPIETKADDDEIIDAEVIDDEAPLQTLMDEIDQMEIDDLSDEQVADLAAQIEALHEAEQGRTPSDDDDYQYIRENDLVAVWVRGSKIEGVVSDVIGDKAIVEWLPGEINTGQLVLMGSARDDDMEGAN